jgi:hypothetical protein
MRVSPPLQQHIQHVPLRSHRSPQVVLLLFEGYDDFS